MKKYKLIVLLLIITSLVACSDSFNKNNSNIKTTNNDKNDKLNKKMISEGELKRKEYSNVVSNLEYTDNNSYKLKIRIEQKDKVVFTTDNQKVYADINISSDRLDNNDIIYHKNTDDKTLFSIPLDKNKIPHVTEILIDENSNLLTKEEHKAILNKEKGLSLSVQIRDPQGYILEISNTIFEEKKQ